MAGKKSTQYLPYTRALHYVQSEGQCTTRKQYQEWVRRERIAFLPIHPNRVYDDWVSWNDYLNTTNSFSKTLAHKVGEKITYRPYWEAVRYAQQVAKDHHITTKDQWEEWYDSGMCAGDIPKRPYQVYDEFTGKGWGVWLGLKAVAKQKVVQNTEMILAFHHHIGAAQNVIMPHIHPGYQSVVDKVNDGSMGKVYRMYLLEDGDREIAERLLSHYGHKQNDGSYIIPNPHALIAECDMDLLLYKRGG